MGGGEERGEAAVGAVTGARDLFPIPARYKLSDMNDAADLHLYVAYRRGGGTWRAGADEQAGWADPPPPPPPPETTRRHHHCTAFGERCSSLF